MCSRSRRGRLLVAIAAVPHARTSGTHGVGYLGERRAESERRWGARARRESEAAACAVRAHFIDSTALPLPPRSRGRCGVLACAPRMPDEAEPAASERREKKARTAAEVARDGDGWMDG
jgi:hypothetical protein